MQSGEVDADADEYSISIELLISAAYLMITICKLTNKQLAERAVAPSVFDRVRWRMSLREAGASPADIRRLTKSTFDVCSRKSASDIEMVLSSLQQSV